MPIAGYITNFLKTRFRSSQQREATKENTDILRGAVIAIQTYLNRIEPLSPDHSLGPLPQAMELAAKTPKASTALDGLKVVCAIHHPH